MLEPVQGEGGFIPMPLDFPSRLREVCDRHGILYVDDEVQSGVGRTGPMWAIEHYGVEPDLLVSGKSLGGGLPLAGVTGRGEVMDAVAARRARRHVRGQPGRLRGGGRRPRRDGDARPSSSARASSGELIRVALDGIAARVELVGEVRGLGPMLALELVEDRGDESAGRRARRRDRRRARASAVSSCSRAASTGTSSESSSRS